MDGRRRVQRAKQELNELHNAFRRLGSGFTSDPMFRSEYSALASAIREAERALDRVGEAVSKTERRAR